MGLLNKIGAFFYTRKSPNMGWIDSSTWGMGEGKMQPTDFDRQVQAYRDTVFSCVTINATTMAGMPLRLYVAKGSKTKTFRLTETKPVTKQQKDYLFSEASLQPYLRKAVDIEEVIDHSFFDLLKNVNGFNNRFDLIELTGIFLDLTGNAYWYLPKNGLGTPAEIWVLYSQWMKIIPDPQEFIKGYVLQRGMKTIKFDESEIVHFKYPSPFSEFYGMGPLMGAANAYDLEKDMTDYEKAMFENMGRPDIVVLAKKPVVNEAERKRVKELWKGAYGGPRKAGKVALLQGDLEIKDFGFPPREMSYLAGRKKTKEQIANAFGIPMSMLTTEAVNLANAKAGNYQHAKNAILPRCRRFEEKLNEKLLPRYDEKLFCAFDSPVPEDKEFRLKEIESHIKSFYSNVNQERQVDGLETVPWGDDILVPMNLMPLGQPAKGVASKEKEKFDNLIRNVAREIAEKIGDSPTNGEKLREQKWQTFIKRQSPYEKKFIDKLKELFGEQEKEVLANMKHSPKAVKKGWEEDWLFNEALWIARFGKEGKPFIGGVLESVGVSTLADLAVGIDFNIDNPRVQRWLGTRLEEYSKSVNGTTLDSIKRTLREGVTAGESIPKLRKRVQGVFEGCSKYRAQMISRTETITASNQGALEAFRQSGVVEKKTWYAALDERTCEICMGMHEETVKLDENFSYGVSTPSAHPSCRCTILPVIEE